MLSRMVFDYAIWSRNEPQRPILLVCEEAHRYIPSDRESTSSVGRILGRIAKEGRKYGVSLGLITPAPVGSRRGRALAMRHDHRDAAQQRSRPGVRARSDARRRARLPRRHPCAAQSRMASSAAKASRSRSACPSTGSRKRAARPRPIRCSPNCGAMSAARKRAIERIVQKWRAQGALAARFSAGPAWPAGPIDFSLSGRPCYACADGSMKRAIMREMKMAQNAAPPARRSLMGRPSHRPAPALGMPPAPTYFGQDSYYKIGYRRSCDARRSGRRPVAIEAARSCRRRAAATRRIGSGPADDHLSRCQRDQAHAPLSGQFRGAR